MKLLRLVPRSFAARTITAPWAGRNRSWTLVSFKEEVALDLDFRTIEPILSGAFILILTRPPARRRGAAGRRSVGLGGRRYGRQPAAPRAALSGPCREGVGQAS